MKNNTTVITLALFLFLSGSFASYGQTEELFQEKQYRSGYVSFGRIKHGMSAKANARKENIVKELTGNNGDLSFVRTVITIPSKRNLRIQQEKIPVVQKRD
jgi:hypothetical protein